MIIFYSPLCLSNDDNYNNKIIEQKDNLNQIQKQIKTLKNDLTNKENDKNLTANKISESTEKINSLQQKLQELNAKYQQKSKQLNKLQNNIKTLDNILQLTKNKIIYVSCNPATLARDLKYLVSKGCTIDSLQPFDMFCHTNHVETVAIVSLNN